MISARSWEEEASEFADAPPSSLTCVLRSRRAPIRRRGAAARRTGGAGWCAARARRFARGRAQVARTHNAAFNYIEQSVWEFGRWGATREGLGTALNSEEHWTVRLPGDPARFASDCLRTWGESFADVAPPSFERSYDVASAWTVVWKDTSQEGWEYAARFGSERWCVGARKRTRATPPPGERTRATSPRGFLPPSQPCGHPPAPPRARAVGVSRRSPSRLASATARMGGWGYLAEEAEAHDHSSPMVARRGRARCDADGSGVGMALRAGRQVRQARPRPRRAAAELAAHAHSQAGRRRT